MKNNKRFWVYIIEILLGITLMVCSFIGVIDSFWGGMGTSLIIVAGLMLAKQIRYKTNHAYRESVDVEVNDERNKYISTKAWSWAGYLFVLIAALATIVLKVLNLDAYMQITSGSVCLIVLLYWISNLILRRKY